MRAGIVLVLMAIVASLSIADEPSPAAPPVPKSARAAVEKASEAERSARAAYNRAMAEVKRVELADLKSAQKSALARNNVDEATALAELAKAVQIEYEAYIGKSIHAIVFANKDWQQLGMLDPGIYLITASGRWSVGPSWPMCGPEGYPKEIGKIGWTPLLGAVMGRVNGTEIPIGARAEVTVSKPQSMIEFRINDPTIEDDRGEMEIVIVRRPPNPPSPKFIAPVSTGP